MTVEFERPGGNAGLEARNDRQPVASAMLTSFGIPSEGAPCIDLAPQQTVFAGGHDSMTVTD